MSSIAIIFHLFHQRCWLLLRRNRPQSKSLTVTHLSVNVNKLATLRNARGGNVPDLVNTTLDIERFGADGITVHPRPDERHIRYDDVRELRPLLKTEFNVEGFPNAAFIDLVMEVKPDQVTLVPDAPDVLTSNAGWDTIGQAEVLSGVLHKLKTAGMRTSLFIDPVPERIAAAAELGADRIELYTEAYASGYYDSREAAIEPYVIAAEKAMECGLGINAGHDLDRINLGYFSRTIPGLLEVSIGHALISDALYFGLENTVQLYKHELMGL
jgi:pyridoxine 5-phosphate synthase